MPGGPLRCRLLRTTRAAQPVAYLYFSYTTLTTVGFGDLTAGTDLGRMLAVVEALMGQLYLVTVVAFIVATRRPRAQIVTTEPERGGSPEAAPEERRDDH